MLPKRLLQYHLAGDEVVPHYLSERDHPWLREIIEVFGHLSGERVCAWESRKSAGWNSTAPEGKRNMAIAVLEQMAERRVRPCAVAPREVRRAVFDAAEAHRGGPEVRALAIADAAHQLCLPVEQVESLIFADLPAERLLALTVPLPDPATLAERTNLALVQGLLNRSIGVDIQLHGNARAVVRQVQLRRLIAVARPRPGGAVGLEVSGVFSIFRRTTLYGRALASIVPVLGWCGEFELAATLALGPHVGRLRLGPLDPIGRGKPPAAYDSKLEARFARDFARAYPEWRLTREPEPIAVDGTLVFPDFEVVRGDDPERRWLVEIVGFWTPEYLESKIGRLARAGRSDLILCVDEDRCGTAAELAPHLPMVPFRRRVDPKAVVAALERGATRVSLPPAPIRIGLGDMFIDFAGRFGLDHPIHQRLSSLREGDRVSLQRRDGRAVVVHDGVAVAALSRRCAQRVGAVVEQAGGGIVRSMVLRQASQTAPEWRHLIRAPRWWVPEIAVFLTGGLPATG